MIRYLAVLLLVLACACGGDDAPTDPDGDGFVGIGDRCPGLPETVNGYEDDDGCPDSIPPSDADGDGVADSIDSCPSQPETPNGYQDSDGCPDTAPVVDTDGDGIPDSSDACPTAAETVNGNRDSDGCPDVSPQFTGRWSGPVTITVTGEPSTQFSGTMNGTAGGLAVQFSPICPLGDGALSTTRYTNQFNVDWTGSLSCAPVAFAGGCQSVVFTFTGAVFALNQSNGNLGAAGGGTATGCGVSKQFTMTFAGVRQ